MAVWVLMKPGGDIKVKVAEATQQFQDDMDTEEKYTANIIGGDATGGDATGGDAQTKG
jgi:hypothetical protein